jgi:hypothetical protein
MINSKQIVFENNENNENKENIVYHLKCKIFRKIDFRFEYFEKESEIVQLSDHQSIRRSNRPLER